MHKPQCRLAKQLFLRQIRDQMSFDQFDSASSSCDGTCLGAALLSQLEVEAVSAVREVTPFVRNIYISEVLVRTPELLFVNVTTLEGHPYCLELTHRGWRICSDRSDSMNGDFRRLEFFSCYYETIYALLDFVSPLYRARFSGSLAQKLSAIADEHKNNGQAPSDGSNGTAEHPEN